MNHYHLMTDKDLICLFQDGEEQAFAELLNRHKNRIYSTIFYLVREPELAEDQPVSVEASTARGRFGALFSWHTLTCFA